MIQYRTYTYMILLDVPLIQYQIYFTNTFMKYTHWSLTHGSYICLWKPCLEERNLQTVMIMSMDYPFLVDSVLGWKWNVPLQCFHRSWCTPSPLWPCQPEVTGWQCSPSAQAPPTWIPWLPEKALQWIKHPDPLPCPILTCVYQIMG